MLNCSLFEFSCILFLKRVFTILYILLPSVFQYLLFGGEGWLAVSLLSFYLLRTLLHTMNGNLILDCHGVSKQQQKYYTILHLLFYGPIMAHILHISISSGCNNCSRVVPSLCVREISCFAYSAFKSLVGFNSEIFFLKVSKSHILLLVYLTNLAFYNCLHFMFCFQAKFAVQEL